MFFHTMNAQDKTPKISNLFFFHQMPDLNMYVYECYNSNTHQAENNCTAGIQNYHHPLLSQFGQMFSRWEGSHTTLSASLRHVTDLVHHEVTPQQHD